MDKVLTLLTMLGLFVTNGAYAETNGGNDHSNADKFIGLMSQAGVHNPTLKKTAYFLDENINDNRFEIAEENLMGFNMKLTHDISTPDYKDLELKITPDNSNYVITGSSEGVIVSYSVPIKY